jgi:hypothetical protein
MRVRWQLIELRGKIVGPENARRGSPGARDWTRNADVDRIDLC